MNSYRKVYAAYVYVDNQQYYRVMLLEAEKSGCAHPLGETGSSISLHTLIKHHIFIRVYAQVCSHEAPGFLKLEDAVITHHVPRCDGCCVVDGCAIDNRFVIHGCRTIDVDVLDDAALIWNGAIF